MEFARHAEVTSALQVQFYFPPPHQPWQRGTNENTNGLLREYFPKEQDLTDISQERIQEVFDELNMRPLNASVIVRPMRSSIRKRCT